VTGRRNGGRRRVASNAKRPTRWKDDHYPGKNETKVKSNPKDINTRAQDCGDSTDGRAACRQTRALLHLPFRLNVSGIKSRKIQRADATQKRRQEKIYRELGRRRLRNTEGTKHGDRASGASDTTGCRLHGRKAGSGDMGEGGRSVHLRGDQILDREKTKAGGV